MTPDLVRLHFLVEGPTEEAYVNESLANHLGAFGISADARDFGGWMRHGRRYERLRMPLRHWIKRDSGSDSVFTTMVDYYGLPGDFPGKDRLTGREDSSGKARILEAAMEADIRREFPRVRFVPYVQMHEFESLLFADPRQLEWKFLEHERAIGRLVELSNSKSPEDINDGQHSHPSARIAAEISDYELNKSSAGPLVASKIGLPKLRERCPHFNDWITRLESLGATAPATS